MDIKITFTIKETEVTVTLDEAKKLWEDLGKLFERKSAPTNDLIDKLTRNPQPAFIPHVTPFWDITPTSPQWYRLEVTCSSRLNDLQPQATHSSMEPYFAKVKP